MIGKLGAFVLVLSVLAAYQINSFYTPEGFERPYVFKLFSGLCALSCSLSRVVDRLGLLNEAHAVRAVSHGIMTPNIVDENIVTEDLWVNEVRLRVYKPKSMPKSAKLPIMVFYHGGGYFFKNLNMYDLYLYHFVNHLNMIVVSVDYRYSPEFPFPQPTEDCFMATKYILENGEKFNADITRLVVAGDSAGGNAVGVVTQRLLKEKLPQPKLQLLIYPWTQMIDLTLPSHLYYGEKDLAGPYRTNLCRVVAWYLGVVDNMSEIEDVFSRNEIFSLIDDPNERNRIIDCLNVDKIGKEYRPNPEYYKPREIATQLSSESILKRDDRLAGLFRKLLDPSVSPLLAHKQDLVGLPKAYFIVLEWDSLKDDSLLYAQRLKEAGVDVKVAFYERAYHGSVTIMDKYQFSKDIFADLVKFLKTEL